MARHRAQPHRLREDQEHRHLEGARDRRRARRAHGQGPRGLQPALDADAHVGHPDGAADRHGHVPGAGGRGGDRDVALRGRRRGRRGRGRVRGDDAGHGSVQGAGGRRAGAADRQGGPGGQPHLALGGRRQGGHGQDLRRGRRGRAREDARAAHPRGVDRDVRVPGRLQPGRGTPHRVHDHAGPARDPHRAGPGGGHVGLSEEKIRVVSPDIGGGFGGRCRCIRGT